MFRASTGCIVLSRHHQQVLKLRNPRCAPTCGLAKVTNAGRGHPPARRSSADDEPRQARAGKLAAHLVA